MIIYIYIYIYINPSSKAFVQDKETIRRIQAKKKKRKEKKLLEEDEPQSERG